MGELQLLVIVVVAGALLFDFANGWNDSANAIATVVSTRVLSPLWAIVLSSFLNFMGAMWGQAVAKTIMKGIVNISVVTELSQTLPSPEMLGLLLTLSAVLGAAMWIIIATRLGLPISGSHSIVGALIGAAFSVGGLGCLEYSGIKKVLIGLALSPLLGIGVGFLLMAAILWGFRRVSSTRVNRLFGKLQLLSVSFMAFSHGTNDAQKAMGVITLALVTGGLYSGDQIPPWVILACGLVMAAGTAAGGWRVIRTLGLGLMHLKPVHGFAAETAASGVLMAAASLGIPVSTTHTITASIVGVGTTQGVKAVQWGLGKKIVYVWVLTFPATMILGYVLFKLCKLLFLGAVVK